MVTPVLANLYDGTIKFDEPTVIPDGTVISSFIDASGAELLSPEASSPEAVSSAIKLYCKTTGDRELKLFSNDKLTIPVDNLIWMNKDQRLEIHFLGKFGERAYVKTYRVLVPVTDEVEQTYTEEIPELFTSTQQRTTMIRNNSPLRDIAFADHDRAILHGATVVSGVVPYNLRELTGNVSGYRAITKSVDGNLVAALGVSGSCDPCGGGTIEVWDATTGEKRSTIVQRGESFTAIAFHPDSGNLIAATGNCDATIRSEPEPKTLVAVPVAAQKTPAWSGTLLEIDPLSGEVIKTLLSGIPNVKGMQASQAGEAKLVLADELGTIQLLNLDDLKVVNLAFKTTDPESLQIDRKGRLVVSRSPSGAVRVVATDNPSVSAVLSFGNNTSADEWNDVRFSPSGLELLAVSKPRMRVSGNTKIKTAETVEPCSWNTAEIIRELTSDSPPATMKPKKLVAKRWVAPVITSDVVFRDSDSATHTLLSAAGLPGYPPDVPR